MSHSDTTDLLARAPLLRDPLTLRRRARRAADMLGALSPRGALYSAHLRGQHGRKRAGSGDSFWQFRTYMPGDSAAMIDWRRSARSNDHFVRQYEWEAARDIWLALDMGPHMAFKGEGAPHSKLEEAAILAVALAHLLTRGGERVGLLGHSERPVSGKYGTDLIAEKIIQGVPRPQPDMSGISPPGRGTTTIWISDFLTPIDRLHTRLQALMRGGTRLNMVQILDEEELQFPFSGRMMFEGPSRTDGHLIESAQDIKTRYLSRLDAHQDQVTALAREAGAAKTMHVTGRSLSPTLISLHAMLENPLVRE